MHERRTRALRSPIVPLVAIALGAGGLDAQPLRPGVLAGRILSAAGGAVDRPVVRVSQGATIHLSEGEDDGDYRVEGLGAGRWQVSVRREGFAPLIAEIEMPARGLRRDFTLVEREERLDAELVASGWSGVRGVVTDSRGSTALPGASLRLMGSDAIASTDSTGRFALPLPAGRDFILRIGRIGFETRLLTGRIPETGYLAVEIPLDTTDEEGSDYWIWRDLERRLMYATPRAALMTRTEVARTRAASLGSAIEAGRSVGGRGLVVTTGACLFVDGLPRPGATVDAIRAEDVEFVEVYPAGTDLTRTLASRWPANAVCGHGNLAARPADPRRAALFVAVWLRAP
jgi:hypothetical protein